MIDYSIKDKAIITQKVKALQHKKGFEGSMPQFARTIEGITYTDLSHLFNKDKQNDPDRLTKNKWMRVAMAVRYNKNKSLNWQMCDTHVSDYIGRELQTAQSQSMTAILVDMPGIGKTYTAQHYCDNTKDAYYIDCSVTPRKIAFVRKLAMTLGLDTNVTIDGLISEIEFVLLNTDTPLLVLDEAGDLDGLTILVLKRLYNALNGYCGIYLMGSDGLKSKLERGIKWQTLGFVEFFSRFGGGFRHALPQRLTERIPIMEKMAVAIGKANGVTDEGMLDWLKRCLTEQKDKDEKFNNRQFMGQNQLLDLRKVKQVIKAYKRQQHHQN